MKNANLRMGWGFLVGCGLAWGPITTVTTVVGSQEQTEIKESRLSPQVVDAKRVAKLRVVTTPVELQNTDEGGVAGDCPAEIVTHTDANFAGGSFLAQGGFAENEIAAVEFAVPAGDFPLRVDLMEMIFATSAATVSTTTQWSVLVWEGNPETGTLVASFSSDGTILPHIVMPPGTNGTNVQVSVDPGDPEQIIVTNTGGNTSFSVGFRIDQHNNQTQDPCFVAPPSNSNAFPTVDTSGLSQPTRNWLYAVDCGPFGCPAGWSRFNQLGLCQPSGDWILRVTYTPTFCADAQGACCIDDGSCLGPVSQPTCLQTLQGTFQGQGSACLPGLCPQPTIACCFEGNPPSCADLIANDCAGFGGINQGTGTDCASTVCFPRGACCNPIGTCTNDVAQTDCVSGGGTFQGNNTLCSQVSCPQPNGACCSNTTTFCTAITQSSCSGIPNTTWAGAFTTCVDGDSNGEADACESQACITNIDCDDNNVCTCDRCTTGACANNPREYGNANCSSSPITPNLDDILCVLAGFASFNSCPDGDISPGCTGNDLINLDDILAGIAAFGGSDPCNCTP